MTDTGKIDHRALEQAAEWFATLNDPRVTPGERAAWRAWLHSDRAHARAWARVRQVDGLFPGLPKQEAQSALRAADKRWKLPGKGLLSVLVLLPILWLASPLPWPALESRPDYQTQTGQIAPFTLAEGTIVWLNTDSALDVDYDAAQRRLTLLQGEALVDSAPDHGGANRPLIVATAHGRIRAVGTRFSVRRHAETTVVHVFEGRVSVARGNGADSVAVLAGRMAEFNRQDIVRAGAAVRARAAWVKGILIADNTPLCDFTRDLERYFKGNIDCPEEIAHLRLVGVYPLRDTARILAAIQTALPVHIRRRPGGYAIVSAPAGARQPGRQ